MINPLGVPTHRGKASRVPPTPGPPGRRLEKYSIFYPSHLLRIPGQRSASVSESLGLPGDLSCKPWWELETGQDQEIFFQISSFKGKCAIFLNPVPCPWSYTVHPAASKDFWYLCCEVMFWKLPEPGHES